jgi:integrase
MYPYIRRILESAPRDGEYVTKLNPALIGKRFTNGLNKAGLPHYRFHDLRHYLVSVMLSLNIPKNYIADMVGHTDEHMIDTVYGHLMAQKKHDVEDILEEYFSKSATII